MKFLVDRCAGRRLAAWLHSQRHDVLESPSLGSDPGDLALLQLAHEQERVLVTIDTDFGTLAFRDKVPHHGLIRLPDLPAQQRIALMADLLEHHHEAIENGCLITVKGDKVRIGTPFQPG